MSCARDRITRALLQTAIAGGAALVSVAIAHVALRTAIALPDVIERAEAHAAW